MIWARANRADARCARLADRHYPRRAVGSDQFLAPGRSMILHMSDDIGEAVFAMLWQKPEFVDHAWPRAWLNALFRNESGARASALIRQGIAAALFEWGQPPDGIITFVDRSEVRPKANPGHCYIIAGFREIGETQGGHLVLRMRDDRLPTPMPARFAQHRFLDAEP